MSSKLRSSARVHSYGPYDAPAGGRAYFGTFEQAPACINVLDVGDDGWIVRTVNYVPYDPLHPARTTTMEHLWEQLRPFLDERA